MHRLLDPRGERVGGDGFPLFLRDHQVDKVILARQRPHMRGQEAVMAHRGATRQWVSAKWRTSLFGR